LNEFLLRDSRDYLNKLLSVTYLIESENATIAFFSVSNDKISVEQFESEKEFRKKIRKRMPRNKHYKSYPAVKLGRFAIHCQHQNTGLGRKLLDYLKGMFIINNKTGCQYITVDAYAKSLGFYEKNGFKYFTIDDAGKDTRQMYFSLLDIIEIPE
jgi:GNAT superfamily N-acetyltransferase